MKLLFGCDPNAAALKLSLMRTAEKLGHECVDMGSEDPIYANTAFKVAEAVAAGEADRGVLVCGTGQRAILSNNANIACLGAFTVGDKLAQELLKTFLALTFDPECASAPKVAAYKAYDAQSHK